MSTSTTDDSEHDSGSFATALLVLALDVRFGHLEQWLDSQLGELINTIRALQVQSWTSPTKPLPPTSTSSSQAPLPPLDLKPFQQLCWHSPLLAKLLAPQHLVKLCNPKSRVSKEPSQPTHLTVGPGGVLVGAKESSDTHTSAFVKTIPNIAALTQIWLAYITIRVHATGNLTLNEALLVSEPSSAPLLSPGWPYNTPHRSEDPSAPSKLPAFALQTALLLLTSHSDVSHYLDDFFGASDTTASPATPIQVLSFSAAACPLWLGGWQISKTTKAKLLWWINTLQSWDGVSLLQPSPLIVEHVWTDASKRCISGHWGSMDFPFAAFTKELSRQHWQKDIRYLEALAVLEALRHFSPLWDGPRRVVVHVDNENIKYGLRKGSIWDPQTQVLFWAIFALCLQQHINLVPIHVSSTANVLADTLSRHRFVFIQQQFPRAFTLLHFNTVDVAHCPLPPSCERQVSPPQ
ncbi:uncharacterized protein UBRO2_05183 [Ustilago bromivora]|uniref:Uncharacterized protein n=1 Tax=Ustilago bromivora TaxID=307758 RepID=A0A8H8QTM2_9BASI|nr:uncharacterized protein UBRO2_05183 [Ustilago bromivora]